MVFYKPTPVVRPINLPGSKLQLRVPQPQDYLSWKHVREASREFLVPWEPRWPDDDLTRFGYRRRLKRYALEREMKTGETYFLVSTEENVPMGGISISNMRYGVARMCNVGYWMGEKYASRGYMRMAVDEVVDYIFEELKLCRIEAACLLHNKRSSRLLESAGFKREGILRRYLEINGARQDHVLYALLREDRQDAAISK
jgi:ribosomal-protein-alanine N-acetyltransferase